MNKLDRSALSDAIADRVRSPARTSERLRALDDHRDSQAHIGAGRRPIAGRQARYCNSPVGFTKSVEFEVELSMGH
jgi:hypothetical protein